MEHLELTLVTADGRVGKQRLSEPSAMAWSGNPYGDGETVGAVFELTCNGVALDNVEIDGDDWRALESEGRGAAAVWEGIQRGWSLEEAVYAARDSEDPPWWNEEAFQAEQALDDMLRQRDEALHHLRELSAVVQAGPDCYDYEVAKAAADYLKGLSQKED